MGAEFRGLQYHLGNMDAAISPSNSFIQVSLRTENPTVDKEVELEVNATEPLNQLVYEVSYIFKVIDLILSSKA